MFSAMYARHNSARSGLLLKLALIELHRVHRSDSSGRSSAQIIVMSRVLPERFVQPLWAGPPRCQDRRRLWPDKELRFLHFRIPLLYLEIYLLG